MRAPQIPQTYHTLSHLNAPESCSFVVWDCCISCGVILSTPCFCVFLFNADITVVSKTVSLLPIIIDPAVLCGLPWSKFGMRRYNNNTYRVKSIDNDREKKNKIGNAAKKYNQPPEAFMFPSSKFSSFCFVLHSKIKRHHWNFLKRSWWEKQSTMAAEHACSDHTPWKIYAETQSVPCVPCKWPDYKRLPKLDNGIPGFFNPINLKGETRNWIHPPSAMPS